MLNISGMSFPFGLMNIHQTEPLICHLMKTTYIVAPLCLHPPTEEPMVYQIYIKSTDVLILQSIYSFPARFYDAIATKALSFTSVQNLTSKRQPHTVKMSLVFRVSD